MAILMAALTGLLIGSVMGLTGAGGGILAVPALVYGQGWSMQQAMPVALLAVTAGAVAGAAEGFSKGLVRYRAAMLMAAAAMIPTWTGVWLAGQLPQSTLMLLFAAILIGVALRLWRQLSQPACDEEQRALATVNSATGRFVWNWKTGGLMAGIGSLAGLMTGLLGVGGGFIIVPMLRHFTNLTIHGAIATSLFFIAMVGTLGVGSALAHGASLPLAFSGGFVIATIAGMLAGRRLVHHLPARRVQQGFALMLSLVALSLCWRALGS